MRINANSQENQILAVSAILASAFAVGGLVLGIITGSLVILFDGFYSLVSLLLTLLSLAVARYIQQPAHATFPFGKAILEPIVIAFKGAAILAVVMVSLHSAVIAMFSGGRAIDITIASLFGFVNVVGCGFAWWYIAHKSKNQPSDLIEAETKQWKMDTLLSVAVTLGFVFAYLLNLTSYSQYAVYADPFMMCLISAYFIKVPFDMLKQAVKELLMMKPNDEICAEVDERLLVAKQQARQKIMLTGLTKVGRELRIDVNIQAEPNKTISVEDIEHTRSTLSKHFSDYPLNLQLNLSVAR